MSDLDTYEKQPQKIVSHLTYACVPGSKRLKSGQAGEDTLAISVRVQDQAMIIVVADGAGSARYAREGAEKATSSLTEAIVQEPSLPTSPDTWKTKMVDWVNKTRYQLEVLANESDIGRIHDFSTTLLAVIITHEHVAALQIGDGAIVIRNKDGDISLQTTPFRGEYVSEVVFLTSQAYDKHLSTQVADRCDLRDIAIMTDGIEDIAIKNRDKPFAPFFEYMFDFSGDSDIEALKKNMELDGFLRGEKVNKKSDDDKTLVLVNLEY